jgi:hypothetical protein
MYDDDTTDFDSSPNEDGGPWVRYYAKASDGGAILAGGWGIRMDGGMQPIDLSRGFVIAWKSTRTGWFQSRGPAVPPVKQWNPSRARFEPKPPGDGWAKGLSVPIAYAKDAMAIWEQAGVGAWATFSALFVVLMRVAPQQFPKLPLIKPLAPTALRLARGNSLSMSFDVVKFVACPPCLSGDFGQPQIAARPPAPSLVAYVPPPSQAHRAPIQPSGWDEPHSDRASPGTMNTHGKGAPLPSEPPNTELLDSDIEF